MQGEGSRGGKEALQKPPWAGACPDSAEFPCSFTHLYIYFPFLAVRVGREIKMFIAALIIRVKLDTSYGPSQ